MGQLLESAIKRTELSIAEIAAALGISRRTIYNWFKLEVIDELIMEKISNVIKYDFSSGMPKATLIDLETPGSLSLKDDGYWKHKYVKLLERYSELITSNKKQ